MIIDPLVQAEMRGQSVAGREVHTGAGIGIARLPVASPLFSGGLAGCAAGFKVAFMAWKYSPHFADMSPSHSCRSIAAFVKTIDLVYFNAGGGHRAAATALDTVIREQGRPWQVRPVNFMEVPRSQEGLSQDHGDGVGGPIQHSSGPGVGAWGWRRN